MTKNTMFTISSDKLAQVIEMTAGRVDSNEVAELVVRYDWDNADEHQGWLNEAPAAEIADWVKTVADSAR